MGTDAFKHAEDEYFRLKGMLSVGRLTTEQFRTAVQNLRVQDAQARTWSLAPEDGRWIVWNGNAWLDGDPYTGAITPRASPPRPLDLPELGGPNAPLPGPAGPPPPLSPPGGFGPPPPIPLNDPRYAAPPPVPMTDPRYNVPPIPVTPVYAVPPPAQQTRRGGCGGCFVFGCLVPLLLLVVVGVGGFLAIRSGAISTSTLLNLAGLGPARIEVDNFRDDAILVNFENVSGTPTSSSSSSLGSMFGDQMALNPFDVRVRQVGSAGKYRLDFQTKDGKTFGSCTLNLRGGDNYQFVTLPDRTIVNRANGPAQTGADFVVETSSLCR